MKVGTPVLLLIICMLVSCGSPYFESEKEIEHGIWTYDNPFSFTFQAEDTVNRYDFLLEIEHDHSYPYQNIYIEVQTIFPDGDTINDPFSVNLADKFGKWNGNCWGDECSLSVPIQSNVKFKTTGKHQLTFSQYTRQDSLKGIQSLEFSIVESTAQQE